MIVMIEVKNKERKGIMLGYEPELPNELFVKVNDAEIVMEGQYVFDGADGVFHMRVADDDEKVLKDILKELDLKIKDDKDITDKLKTKSDEMRAKWEVEKKSMAHKKVLRGKIEKAWHE